MNVNTGEVREYELLKKEFEEGRGNPEDWKGFQLGELIPLKGMFFELAEISDKKLVLKYHSKTKASKRKFLRNGTRKKGAQ